MTKASSSKKSKDLCLNYEHNDFYSTIYVTFGLLWNLNQGIRRY